MDTMRSSTSPGGSWDALPKQCTELFRSEPFSIPLNGVPLGETLLRAYVPLLADVIEVIALLRERSISLCEYGAYVESSPSYEPALAALREITLEFVRKQPPPVSMAAITSKLSALLRGILSVYQRASRQNASAEAVTFGFIVTKFSVYYAEMLYLQSTASHVFAGKHERSIEASIRAAGMHLGLQTFGPGSLKQLWRFIGDAGGRFAQDLRCINAVGSVVCDGMQDRMPQLREWVLSGCSPQRCYAQLRTPAGHLQCTVELVREECREPFMGVPGYIVAVRFNSIPQGHSGFFRAPLKSGSIEGTWFFLSGLTGELIASQSVSTPLELLIPRRQACLLYSLVQELAHEAFTGEFKIGARVPEGEVQPAVATPAPEPAREEKRFSTANLPRNVKRENFIRVLKAMNRKILVECGFSGDDLEKKAEPRLRQKGSHATVYFAGTDRIVTVPMHTTEFPIWELRSKLDALGIDPVHFLEALG